MKIELNESKVRQIATRVRAALFEGQPTHSQLLELLSSALGFRNWDTMSGILKRESQPRLVLERPVTLYVEVFATGLDDSLDWAQVVIDQVFLDQLLSLQALCEDQRLSHVASLGEPALWQGEHREHNDDPVNFDSSHLYVDARRFWFRALPRHYSSAFETRSVDIEMLKAALVHKVSCGPLAWYADRSKAGPDVLVASSTGNTLGFLNELVEDQALARSYLPA